MGDGFDVTMLLAFQTVCAISIKKESELVSMGYWDDESGFKCLEGWKPETLSIQVLGFAGWVIRVVDFVFFFF